MNTREPPLTRLPPELLALVFESLDEEERMFCTMSYRYWQSLIKGLWPNLKVNPDEILDWAAETGNTTLIRFITKWGAKSPDYNQSIINAAKGGHTDCLKLLVTRSPIITRSFRYIEILLEAAAAGHTECMILAKTWGVENFDIALSFAAKGGQIECMELLKKWGVTDFNEALESAAYGGQLACMKLLKEWGAINFNLALNGAARGGHLNCMKLAKRWGATDFEKALKKAAHNDHLNCVKLLKKWIKEQNEG